MALPTYNSWYSVAVRLFGYSIGSDICSTDALESGLGSNVSLLPLLIAFLFVFTFSPQFFHDNLGDLQHLVPQESNSLFLNDQKRQRAGGSSCWRNESISPLPKGSQAPKFIYEKYGNIYFEMRSTRNIASLLNPLNLFMGIPFCLLPTEPPVSLSDAQSRPVSYPVGEESGSKASLRKESFFRKSDGD